MRKHKRYKRQITKRTRIVTREEESKIIVLLQNASHGKSKCYYPEVADLVAVLLDTGMRLGEALELQHEDVDFESNLIIVRISKSDRNRRVPMTIRVASIMKRKLEIGQQQPFSLTTTQVQIAWAWVKTHIEVKEADLLVLHSLRYTCGSRLVNAGVPMDIASEWLFNSCYRGFTRLAPITVQQLNKAVAQLEAYEE